MNRFACALMFTLLVVAALAGAQNPQADAAASSDPLSNQPQLITLDFSGGNVAQYIDAVRQASNNANIVVIGDVTPIQMPAVRLKNVDTWAAVNILNSLPQQQKDLLVNIQASISSDEPDQARVYTVSAMTTRAGSLGASVESTVMTVADVLQGEITADDLLTAVKLAVDVVGMADEPADIKFHKETGLLIARGSADQIAAIHEVVDQLRLQIRHRSESQNEHISLNDARAEIVQLQIAIGEKNAKIAQLNALIDKLKSQLPPASPQ